MGAGPFTLYGRVVTDLLDGSAPSPLAGPLAAILLSSAHNPDPSSHTIVADVLADQIAGSDYAPANVLGQTATALASGARFSTDPVSFGQSVTIPPCRYLTLVQGNASDLRATDRLIGLVDLAPDGATVQSFNAEFTVTPPAEGWFSIETSAAGGSA